MDYLKTEINRIVKTAISTRARRLALVLSCLVIFVTTYLLILPAFTLEKDKALEQDGIDLPSVEETVDADADTDANANANANANVDGDSEVQEEITEEITEEIVVEDDGDADITDDTADEVDSLLFEGEDYTIAVSDESSVLPGDAELAVAEIDKTTDPDAYEAYCDSALAAIRNTDGGERVKRFSFAKLYDIALLSQGTEIEPQEAVSVRIDYDEALQKSLKVENTDSLRIVHFVEDSETGEVEAQVLDSEKVEVNTDKKDKLTDATFSADSFSVYAIVYTVDFHWNVDGEKFDHSLQGGGFISLEALVDALGIADGDPHEFAANVDSVKFSSPELVWVGKTDEDTTIGALKDANDLECEYSADLTDDDIADINDQTVNAGDWVLISMHPFDSEETLTVTMKNGDRFVINVTDIQTIPSDDDFLDERIDSSKACIICYQDSDGYHVLKTDGSQQTFTDTSGFDALDNSYRWNFYYVFKEKDRATSIDNVYYFIRPVADKTRTIALSDTGESLVQKGANNIAVHPQGGDGFILEGYDGTGGNGIKLWFDNNEFKASDTNSRVIQIYQQDPLPEYRFTVATDSSTMGKVAGRTDTGQSTGNSGVNQYTSVTNTDQNPEHDKTNRYEIRAIATPNTSNPNNPRYIFDHWELNGETIQVGTVNNQTTPTVATIPAGALTIPYNMADLKAVFTNNPNYNYTKEEKQGRLVDTTTVSKLSDELKELNLPLVEEGCTKTAEVYDYENRIYRVDLTSRGNLATFSGDIDLSFILDVSASMLFPSKLIKANESPNWRDHLTNEVVQIRYINDYGAGGRRNWQNWGFRTDRTYYLISDEPQTATVYKLWYDESNWRREDASKTSNGEVIGHETKFKEKEYAPGDPRNNDHNYTYQIYVDGDNGRTRAYYLEQSLNGAAQEMSDVRNVLSLTTGGKTDLDIKIAWNTFCNYITPQRSYNFTSVVPGGFRLNYDRNDFGGGTSTDIAILDAAGIKRSDVVRYTDIYDNTQYNGWVDGRQYSNNYKYSLWEINDSNSITYSDHIAGRGFQWTTENNRYAVLITDGAPQRGGKSIDMNLIRKAADKLKDQGVTLITIGLSMENVDGGSELLFDIANKSKDDNYPLFYSAKSGDELDAILNQIIRGLIDDAIVVGNITDKVGDAFYPVDKETGKPLVANDIIDLNGNFLCNGETHLSPQQKAAGYGKITVLQDGTYQVEWIDQNIYCTSAGWHGTIYQKAYEDLLGGNALLTNKDDAVIEATGYKMSASDTNILRFKDEMTSDNNPLPTRRITKESPRVNVNELSFNRFEDEWTVYLGTEVDPKTQLQRMFEDVVVGEVVNDGKDTDHDRFNIPDMIDYSDESSHHYPISPDDVTDARESSATEMEKTFKLSELLIELIEDAIANGDTSRNDWGDFIDGDKIDFDKLLEVLMNGDTIVIPYDRYGINDPTHTLKINGQEVEHHDNSTITISLTQNVAAGEKDLSESPHETEVIGKPVEQYTLTIVYSPDYDVLPKGQGGKSIEDFQVGTYGTMYQGHAAGTETSENKHTINVFAKSLNLTKTDETYINTLNGAEFTLYRTARDSDSAEDRETLEGLDGEYVAAEIVTMSPTREINPLKQLKTGEKYYLVETKTPEGYNTITTPIEVSLVITNRISDPTEEDEEGHAFPAEDEGIYSNDQVAVIVLSQGYTQLTDAAGNAIGSVEPDSESGTIYYKIQNNSGVELPDAGGIGTTIFYVLGSILVLTGSIYLVAKRRMTRG